MKLSERAAKALFPAGRAMSRNLSQEEAAAIIAKETGCDANADIVRRLLDWADRKADLEYPDLMLRDIIEQARAAALRAGAGGGA